MAFNPAGTVFVCALLEVHHAVDGALLVSAESMVLLGRGEGQTHGGLMGFDPGNWVYAQALSLLCPELMRAVDSDEETKGDLRSAAGLARQPHLA